MKIFAWNSSLFNLAAVKNVACLVDLHFINTVTVCPLPRVPCHLLIDWLVGYLFGCLVQVGIEEYGHVLVLVHQVDQSLPVNILHIINS